MGPYVAMLYSFALTLSMLGNNLSILKYVSWFSQKIGLYNVHEMSNPIFWKKTRAVRESDYSPPAALLEEKYI